MMRGTRARVPKMGIIQPWAAMNDDMGLAHVMAAKITKIVLANCMVNLPSPLELE
jgi:hypothetical protein